ncbi:hypothetical protein ACFLT7_03795 [candidate division KSB1 bacterium]
MKKTAIPILLLAVITIGCLGKEVRDTGHGVGGPCEIWSRVTDGLLRSVRRFEMTVYDSHDYSRIYGQMVFENTDGYFKFVDLPADTVDIVVRTELFFTAKIGEITLLPGINVLRDFGAYVPTYRPDEEMIILASISSSVYDENQLFILRKSFISRDEMLAMAWAVGCDTVNVPNSVDEDNGWDLFTKPENISLKSIIDLFAFRREAREVYPNIESYGDQ